MQGSGVTPSLLWVESCEQCRTKGELPYRQMGPHAPGLPQGVSPIRLNNLVLSGNLWTYLTNLNEQAQQRMESGFFNSLTCHALFTEKVHPSRDALIRY